MSYIGASPTTAAFLTDTFSANGSGTVFTLSTAPANTNSILVAVSGVLQDPSTYSVSGTTLTFSAAPPAGTGNISVRFLGIPASGVTTTAYRTQTEFTATAGQTTFTPPSYTVGFIDVYPNGVLLGSADFTASNGTTVVLTNPATAGDLIETTSFLVSSVLNALPLSGGNLSGNLNVTAGNLGVGTSSPSSKLHVTNTGASDSFVVEDSTNPDSSPFVIDASGRVIKGHTSAIVSLSSQTPVIQQHGTTAEGATHSLNGWGSLTPWVQFNRSVGTSVTDYTAVADTNRIGRISFAGSDGTQFVRASSIEAEIDGTPGTNDMPGRLVFLTTPDGASTPIERGRFDSSGNFKFNSGYGSAATAYGCRAWVNFNGTGTVAIRASGNVSSITDNGTGDYTVNLTTAMPDADYSVAGTAQQNTAGSRGDWFLGLHQTAQTTSARRVSSVDSGGNPGDALVVNVQIFR